MLRRFMNHPFSTHITYYIALIICLYLLLDATVGVMFGTVNAQSLMPREEVVPVQISHETGATSYFSTVGE